MSGVFDFCPNSLVPELLPPEAPSGMSLNGWNFSAKPTIPYQRSWKVTLHGLRWYLNSNGTYDNTTDPTRNARRLEEFYAANQTWDSFTWAHPHEGALTVRFKSPVTVTAGMSRSGGLVPAFEITLVAHNPGY